MPGVLYVQRKGLLPAHLTSVCHCPPPQALCVTGLDETLVLDVCKLTHVSALINVKIYLRCHGCGYAVVGGGLAGQWGAPTIEFNHSIVSNGQMQLDKFNRV
jgi:hypothetical protein